MNTRRKTRASASIALSCACAWVLLGAACSDTQAPNHDGNPLACGAGTQEVNRTCVALPADAGAAPFDATTEVAAPPVGDSGAGDEGPPSAADAGQDTAPPEPPSDPCPDVANPGAFVALDCDSKCPGGVAGSCDAYTCALTVTGIMGRVNGTPLSPPYQFRTPEAPGALSACTTQCPGSGYVYGLGFQIDTAYPGAFTVKVGPPWEVIKYSKLPYCTDATSFVVKTCAYLAYPPSGYVFIMTKDPNAPARNVLVEPQPDPNLACR
jgi:hypothetical protein